MRLAADVEPHPPCQHQVDRLGGAVLVDPEGGQAKQVLDRPPVHALLGDRRQVVDAHDGEAAHRR